MHDIDVPMPHGTQHTTMLLEMRKFAMPVKIVVKNCQNYDEMLSKV
jgi:hypothetical protein